MAKFRDFLCFPSSKKDLRNELSCSATVLETARSTVQMKQEKIQRQPLERCFRACVRLHFYTKISMVDIFKYVHTYSHVKKVNTHMFFSTCKKYHNMNMSKKRSKPQLHSSENLDRPLRFLWFRSGPSMLCLTFKGTQSPQLDCRDFPNTQNLPGRDKNHWGWAWPWVFCWKNGWKYTSTNFVISSSWSYWLMYFFDGCALVFVRWFEMARFDGQNM